MFSIFTKLANVLVYDYLSLNPETKLAQSFHFFIEDTTKIFTLLIFMIYIIAWFRASLNIDKVRNYLMGKNRFFAYFLASLFGSITPFCSCSSIPLFLGFTQAGIPLGITMSFLITSPIINEVAVVLLGSLLGLKFMIIYVSVGILAGIIGGIFIDLIKAEKYLTPLILNISNKQCQCNNINEKNKMTLKDRHNFAKNELFSIFSKIWIWVFVGVGLGAALHGFVPQEFVLKHLSAKAWWSVPASVLIGIPLYSSASGIIPVAESLIRKGLPIGTSLAFMMSTVAASFPEFMILKQVMKPKLLIIFFFMLLVLFTLVGWFFNMVY